MRLREFWQAPAQPTTEYSQHSKAQRLPFDCLYLIFSALDELEHADPSRVSRSSDPIRAYLYEPFELEDPASGRWQLMACSLVCKAWSLPAQLRMLRHTKIEFSSQGSSLINYLANEDDRATANHVQVLELGRDAPPHAGCCYSSASEYHDWRPSRRDLARQNLTRWQTFDLLRRCHRIRQLTLQHWRPDDLLAAMDPRSPYLPPISFDVLARHLPFERLENLRLFRFSGSFRSLYDILMLTPKLTNFSFEGAITDEATLLRQVAAAQPPAPNSKSPDSPSLENQIDLDLFAKVLQLEPAPFSLERLSVGGYNQSFLIGFSWLLSRSWSTLNRLDLGRCSAPAASGIVDLFAGLEQSARARENRITHLSVTLSPGVDVPRMIRACPQLRALRIDGTPPISAGLRAQQQQQDVPAGDPLPAGSVGPALGAAILAAQRHQRSQTLGHGPPSSAAGISGSGASRQERSATASQPRPSPPPLPATMRALHLYTCLDALAVPLFSLNLCFLSSPRSSLSSSHSALRATSAHHAPNLSISNPRISLALSTPPMSTSPNSPSFSQSQRQGCNSSASSPTSPTPPSLGMGITQHSPSSYTHAGRSPSSREMALMHHLLTHSPLLQQLWSLSLEFAPRHAFPDAPLTELRAVREFCDRAGLNLSMPDLYDLVQGWTGGLGSMSSTGGGRRSPGSEVRRHSRFFSTS
jgi:hypothetical protein